MKERLPEPVNGQSAPDGWSRTRFLLTRFLSGTALYGLTLRKSDLPAPRVVPSSLWTGDPEIGNQIIDGHFRFGGETITQNRNPWEAMGASAYWLDAVNSFEWLRDLAAMGGKSAQKAALRFVTDWIDHNAGLSAPGRNANAWSGPVLGRRLTSWLTHYNVFFANADNLFKRQFLDSIGRQMRHLQRVCEFDGEPAGRIAAVKGLIIAQLSIHGESKRLDDAVVILVRLLKAQIYGDGGHVTRSPWNHLLVLRDLVELRAAFHLYQIETPHRLQQAIDLMTPALRFFLHGDHGLCLFNDTREGNRDAIASVLEEADAHGAIHKSLPHTGFERSDARGLTTIMDTGTPAHGSADIYAHAGTLSVEISVDGQRMVVNCGASPSHQPDWRMAQKSTAAHSTLVVEETNSSSFDGQGHIKKRRARAQSKREDDEGRSWITASHNGYQSNHGLVHMRKVFVDNSGDDIRGQDRLEGPAGKKYTVRFHLHPSVQVSMLQNQASALIRMPDGQGWRMRVEGATMQLADSVYFGSGRMRKCQQIILNGVTGTPHPENGQSALVKWGFHREAR